MAGHCPRPENAEQRLPWKVWRQAKKKKHTDDYKRRFCAVIRSPYRQHRIFVKMQGDSAPTGPCGWIRCRYRSVSSRLVRAPEDIIAWSCGIESSIQGALSLGNENCGSGVAWERRGHPVQSKPAPAAAPKRRKLLRSMRSGSLCNDQP